MKNIFKLMKYVLIFTLFIMYLFGFKNFIFDMNIGNFCLCILPGLFMLYAICYMDYIV